MVEQGGGNLSPEYLEKRRAWESAIEAERYAGYTALAAATLAASIHVAGSGARSRVRRPGRARLGELPQGRTG